MAVPHLIRIDASQPEASQQLLTQPPLLTSHSAGWEALYAEHHKQPATEIPEAEFVQHTIVLPLSYVPDAEIRINGHLEDVELQPNELIVVPAEADYWAALHGQTEFFAIALDTHYVSKVAKQIPGSDLPKLAPVIGESDPLIYGTGLSLKAALGNNYPNSRLYVRSLRQTLAVQLLSRHSDRTINPSFSQVKLSPHQLSRTKDYIRAHLSSVIQLQQLAAYLEMNPYSFTQRFYNSVGIKPYQYIIKQRVQKAIWMLKAKGFSISEVASVCGFANSKHLSRVFQAHIGVTPEEFKRQS